MKCAHCWQFFLVHAYHTVLVTGKAATLSKSVQIMISNRKYEITVVQEILIVRLELQRWLLEFVFPFFKVYIWDLGLRFG